MNYLMNLSRFWHVVYATTNVRHKVSAAMRGGLVTMGDQAPTRRLVAALQLICWRFSVSVHRLADPLGMGNLLYLSLSMSWSLSKFFCWIFYDHVYLQIFLNFFFDAQSDETVSSVSCLSLQIHDFISRKVSWFMVECGFVCSTMHVWFCSGFRMIVLRRIDRAK
jgi:hypothetical protein